MNAMNRLKEEAARNVLLALNWRHPKLHMGVATYAKEAGWHLNSSAEYSGRLPMEWTGNGIITHRGVPAIESYIKNFNRSVVSVVATNLGPCVCDDREETGRIAARYFHSRGFRKMLYYCPHIPPENDLRRAGFESECGELECAAFDLHAAPLSMTWSKQCEYLSKQLKQADLPIAVFAFEDCLSTEILDAALAAGLRVPEDVSILGVNNDELLCETQQVSLSSIENNLVKVGYEAASLLDRLMAGGTAPEKPIMISPEPQIVLRQSTDAYAITHPGLSKALSFIKNHFTESISVPDAARAAGMSESGLRQAFQQYLKRPPGEEISRLRMEFACRLLTETDMKIEDIAESAGFMDRRNLYAAFQRANNITPSQYRKDHLSEPISSF